MSTKYKFQSNVGDHYDLPGLVAIILVKPMML